MGNTSKPIEQLANEITELKPSQVERVASIPSSAEEPAMVVHHFDEGADLSEHGNMLFDSQIGFAIFVIVVSLAFTIMMLCCCRVRKRRPKQTLRLESQTTATEPATQSRARANCITDELAARGVY